MSEKVGRPLSTITRLLTLVEPVLVAPRGRYYHRAPVVLATDDGAGIWLDLPICGTLGDRYLAVDQTTATLLDRAACSRCWPDGKLEQLTMSDADL